MEPKAGAPEGLKSGTRAAQGRRPAFALPLRRAAGGGYHGEPRVSVFGRGAETVPLPRKSDTCSGHLRLGVCCFSASAPWRNGAGSKGQQTQPELKIPK